MKTTIIILTERFSLINRDQALTHTYLSHDLIIFIMRMRTALKLRAPFRLINGGLGRHD